MKSHRMRHGVLMGAAAFWIGAATVASAQVRDEVPPSGALGAHLGWSKTRDADEGNFLGGAHAELRLLRVLGIQGAVDYRSDEKFNAVIAGQQAELNVRQVPVTVSGRVYVPVAPRTQPYGLAGAGWYHLVYDYSEPLEALGFRDRDDDSFGWHLGAGLETLFNQRIGGYLEGRWVFLDPDKKINDTTVEQIEDFNFNSFNLTAGLNFLF
jgi:opacity protein-like surface antigen